VLSRGEMQHPHARLAGGIGREGGSTSSCPFPTLEEKVSLLKVGLCGLVLCEISAESPSPSGVGRQR